MWSLAVTLAHKRSNLHLVRRPVTSYASTESTFCYSDDRMVKMDIADGIRCCIS